MTKRRNYIRVATSDIAQTADMVRYIGYRDVEPTEVPTKVKLDYSRAGTLMHRFSDDEYTYFMQPTIYNNYWLESAVARWASFGVAATVVALPR